MVRRGLADDSADGIHDRFRATAGANHERQAELGDLRPVLGDRKIDLRRRSTVERYLADITDYADDGSAVHFRPDGIGAAEIPAGESLIDHDHSRAGGIVGSGEGATSDRDAEGLKIVRRDVTQLDRKDRLTRFGPATPRE